LDACHLNVSRPSLLPASKKPAHEPTFTAFPRDRSSRPTAVVHVTQRPSKLRCSRKKSKNTGEME
jgi:hypothetical protein